MIGSHTRGEKELLLYSIKVASVAHKVARKKNWSKPTHMGSSFEELVARNPTVKTDLNFDILIKSYKFLKFLIP